VCIAPLPKIHFTVSILSLSRQIFFDQNLLNQSICRIRSTTILWEIERLASNQLVTEKNKYINKIEEFNKKIKKMSDILKTQLSKTPKKNIKKIMIF